MYQTFCQKHSYCTTPPEMPHCRQLCTHPCLRLLTFLAFALHFLGPDSLTNMIHIQNISMTHAFHSPFIKIRLNKFHHRSSQQVREFHFLLRGFLQNNTPVLFFADSQTATKRKALRGRVPPILGSTDSVRHLGSNSMIRCLFYPRRLGVLETNE